MSHRVFRGFAWFVQQRPPLEDLPGPGVDDEVLQGQVITQQAVPYLVVRALVGKLTQN